MSDGLTAASKFLSYVLRHNPAAIGAELDENGWIAIEAPAGRLRQPRPPHKSRHALRTEQPEHRLLNPLCAN
jgi:RNA:NAD 2'-phosphotransferase (TPT1/KptA family)